MNDSREKPLLTVAIPTFMRASYLDVCLTHVWPQVKETGGKVELFVSDNCSPDHTPAVVEKHLASGANIRYVRNAENIGPDANFCQCFTMASGKYVLILADDDLFPAGALNTIVHTLQDQDYGVVHLRSYSFLHDFEAERPKRRKPARALVYTDKERFIRKVNVMLTFISGNVINKSHVDPAMDFSQFFNTNLGQLSWTLSALFNAEKNLYLDEYCIAAQAENSGGYRICKVFGTNFDAICRHFEKTGIPARTFDGIRETLLLDFLPGYILKLRRDLGIFLPEDFYGELEPLFGSWKAFWLVTVPAIRWPLRLATLWYSWVEKYNKLKRLARG